MSDTLAYLLQSYFPGFEVWTSRINDKTYLTVDGFVAYVLKEVGSLIVIEDMTLLDEYVSMYRDEELGKRHDSLYAMHAIVNIIISARKLYNARLITSENQYFDIYMKHAYKSYVKDGSVYIADLISIESNKFPHLTIDDKFYKTNQNRIGYNVAYYPPMEVLDHYRNFSIMGLVIPFDPVLQNARVLIRGVKNVPIDIYRGVLIELMSNGNLNDTTCMDIIDNYLKTVSRDMVRTIPLFKYFNSYVVDKYRLVELGYFEEISNMSGLTMRFINNNERPLKPYITNILRDVYCPLEYITKNKWIVRKNKLWEEILINNKNMTREFLIKNIRKCPNALVKRIKILEPQDERLFKKYAKKIDWFELYENFSATPLEFSLMEYIESKSIIK